MLSVLRDMTLEIMDVGCLIMYKYIAYRKFEGGRKILLALCRKNLA